MNRLTSLWNHVLFEQRDGRDLAAMRISLGLMVLLWWLLLWPDLGLWFHDSGPADIELLDTNWSRYRLHTLDGLSLGQLQAVHLAGALVIVAYTVGLATPLMNIVMVFLLAAYWHRSPWIQNGGDRLLRIFAFYMCFTDSGRAWSIDARLRGEQDGTAPVFSIRLIQLQLLIMYAYTGIAKLAGNTWMEGTAVYYALSDAGYSRFPALLDSLLQYRAVRAVFMGLSWTTLVWEILFPIGVLSRRTRPATLVLGLLLHGGIFLLIAVGIFSWATLWGYLAFLPAGWAGRLEGRVRAWRGGSAPDPV